MNEKLRIEHTVKSAEEARIIVEHLIALEGGLRNFHHPLYSRFANTLALARRKLQEDAGLVLTHAQVAADLLKERA